jgi:GH15 family glucan-1,4-alpha-glucosidase
MYSYGLIGNCQIAAQVSSAGSMDWLCMPRPDSPPVFGRLLDKEGGHFSVDPRDPVKSVHQEYIRNTNVLETTVTTENGDSFRITDFCPRFHQFDRVFRPFSVYRIVEPLSGTPMVKVECAPVNGWEKERVTPARGSSHLRFDIRGESLRVWTNMPMTYFTEAQYFPLREKTYFALNWSTQLEHDVGEVGENFLRQTIEYWREWVSHCSVPADFQKEVIRSALALKLHCYEDTGAILAALTTSLPEEIGHNRNWDYRFCWLRDAAFVVNAFNQLGHFEEMEGFLKFLLALVKEHSETHERHRPVYGIDRSIPLPEKIHENWAGFRNSPPVRSKNQAAEHIQHDVYGEMLVALSPIFFDERFFHLRTGEHQELISRLAAQCARNVDVPDAGLWEIRDGWQVHSFSNLLCWAGLDRAQMLHERGFVKDCLIDLKAERAKAEAAVRRAVVDGYVGNGPTDATPDASLLLLPLLRFPDKELCRNTVLRLEKDLTVQVNGKAFEGFLYRYMRQDDFGRPQSAFLICSFWLVQALARVGEKGRAKAMMDKILISANHLGLFAEHFEPAGMQQLGNFPQAYSHVGLILAAFAVSQPWNEVL